jgi:hypothetical protein
MPDISNKPGAAAKKQRAKKQAGGNQKRQTIDPTDELLDTSAVEFKLLCQLASFIETLAPWEFMSESDIFGFKDPETDELGFVSVMGALGEYTAVAVYRGVEALYQWRKFEETLRIDAESEEAHDMLLEIPHLQLVIGPPEFIERRDREIIKASRLKFGKQKPGFRSYRPGYCPWFLNREEANHLIHALVQTINIARLIDEGRDPIPVKEQPEDRNYLVCLPQVDGPEIEWKYSIQRIDPPPTHLIPFSVDDATVVQLKEFIRSGAQEIELSTLPVRVGTRNERPRLIYSLLAADSASGLIVGFEALEGVDGIDLMYASLAERMASNWLQQESVPEEIRARSVRLLNAFENLAGELGVALCLVEELPAIDEARSFVDEQMQGGSWR